MHHFHIASTYAKALFSLAEEAKALIEVRQAFFDFMPVATSHAWKQFSLAPHISKPTKIAILQQELLDENTPPLFRDFLAQLLVNNRLKHLPSIYKRFSHLTDNYDGVVHTTVRSAHALDEENIHKLKKYLQKTLHKKPTIKNITDPRLVGGFRLNIGSLSLDWTVKTQLETLQQKVEGFEYDEKSR